MIQKTYKYSDITEKIIGCAMRVHSKMRNGYVEAVYQKCLAIELKKSALLFQTEVDHPIYYEGLVVGRRRVDFLIEDKVAVEIKAVTEITDALSTRFELFGSTTIGSRIVDQFWRKEFTIQKIGK